MLVFVVWNAFVKNFSAPAIRKLNSRTRRPLIYWLGLLLSAIVGYFLIRNSGVSRFSISPEMFLLVLVFCAWPAWYFLTVFSVKRKALYALIPIPIGILMGSYWLSPGDKNIWQYLEWIRYVLIPLVLLFEGYVLYLVVKTYRQFVRKDFSEDELQQRIRKLVGEGVPAGLLGNTKVNLRSLENAQMAGGRVRRRKEIVTHVAAGSANVKLELKARHSRMFLVSSKT